MPDCSIRLEAANAEGLRRLTGSHSSHTQWTQSSLPPPPHLPTLAVGSADIFLQHQSEDDRSPPPHGPLSPVLVTLTDSPTVNTFTSPGTSPHSGIVRPDLLLQSVTGISSIPETSQASTLLLPPRPRSKSGSSAESAASNWWDNYCDRSSYEVGEQEFWSEGRDIQKIPIVSTDISELGFSSSDSESEVFTLAVCSMAPTVACEGAAKARPS